MKPPPLPADTLRRVIKIARLDGMSVIVVSGLCALVAAAMGDLVSAFFGLIVAAAGCGEWHGAKLLRRGEARGLDWLVRSQLYLLSVILIYAMTRMASYDPEYVRSLITPEIKQIFQEAGMSVEDIMPLVRRAFYAGYGTLAVVTLIYQGGLALYYRRRAAVVQTALDGK
jgi:hypothetical protein